MAITSKELQTLARLAKLEFSEEELEKFRGGFVEMISFCDGINSEIEGDTSSIREVDSREIEWEDLREDCVEESLPNEKILSNVQGERGYYWTGTRQWRSTGAVSLWVGVGHSGAIGNDYRFQGCSIRPVLGTDSTTFTYDSPLDTVDRRVDMGVLSDSGRPLYWASGDLVVRRFARAYIAHEPTFVPEHPIFEDGALEWNLFSWGDATGRIKYYSPEWYSLDVSSLPDEISGDARYDIARAQLGGGWRLPTESEWERLFENCTIDCDRRLRYYRTWLTSKTTGNTICFYMSGVIDFISPEHGSYSEGVGEYLSGTKKRTANFFFNMVGEDIAHSDTIMYSSINWSSIGMFFVRPVTE